MNPRRRNAFAAQLAQLAKGATIPFVLSSLCGQCSRGRAWQARFQAMLGKLKTVHSRRRVLQHFLRLFSGAQRHGRMWRVRDAWGYIGRQHRDRIDPETGEVRIGPRGKPSCHVPAAEAGAMAAHEDRGPRQLQNYRRHLRDEGIMGSKQPPVRSKDAVRPRDEGSCWAYSQHWMVGIPSPTMLALLDGVVTPRAMLHGVDAEEAERTEYLGIVLAGEDVELARLRRHHELSIGLHVPIPADIPY